MTGTLEIHQTTVLGAWHFVKVLHENRSGERKFVVTHHEGCGNTSAGPGVCTFDDVLQGHNKTHGRGNFSVRVVQHQYSGGRVETDMQWKRIGRNLR